MPCENGCVLQADQILRTFDSLFDNGGQPLLVYHKSAGNLVVVGPTRAEGGGTMKPFRKLFVQTSPRSREASALQQQACTRQAGSFMKLFAILCAVVSAGFACAVQFNVPAYTEKVGAQSSKRDPLNFCSASRKSLGTTCSQ